MYCIIDFMQEKEWDKEYKKSTFLTKESKPQAAVLRFLKWLKKERDFELVDKKILDLGSGTGRNSNYIASLGNEVTGIEISPTAIGLAQNRAHLDVQRLSKYIKQSIGEPYPFTDQSFDLAIDVTSSNSLNEKEREMYLKETHRVLKSNSYFFVRALSKDGDDNAKYLIKNNPGPEKDTYIMPETGIIERVFSREDFIATYSSRFTILHLEKETHYTRMTNRLYKRNFWIAYLKKK
ncbi:MAG: class I SAM-dependent methyltransferase [Candidatus Taylorbacteria bacterium]|nr:class I SAM-dependent methyltransferase [Candidatus Taylorbacteria bacterium]